MSEPVELSARLLRRNVWLPASGLVAVAVGLLLSAGPIEGKVFGALLVWLGAIFAFATTTRNSYPLATPTIVEVTPDGLHVGARAIGVASIIEAKLVPRPGRGGEMVASLTLRGGEQVRLWMREVDAIQLLARLGLSAGDARATFRLATRFRTRFGVLYAAVTASMSLWAIIGGRGDPGPALFGAATWGALLALVPALLLGYVRGRLQIGAEGFTTSWLGRRRMVRFADVDTVATRDAPLRSGSRDVVVTLRSGRRSILRAPEEPDDERERGVEGLALYQHLAAAHARFGQRELEVDLRRRLERGGRSDEAWLADLDALLRGGGARYRIATIEPAQVAVVVRDPLSSAEQRVAAAAALVRFDPTYRGVVRRAADACADVELRAAMEALSEAEGDAAIDVAFRRKRI